MFTYSETTLTQVLRVEGISKLYGPDKGCRDVNFSLNSGEVLAVVGESGSGKTTLLNVLSGRCIPDNGRIHYINEDNQTLSLYQLDEAQLRKLMRTDIGFVHQNPRDGLRLRVSAGGNIGEQLMNLGHRNYASLRSTSLDWLEQVEIEEDRIDDHPRFFSGGMQQRLQIARTLVTQPRLVFMDEPTGGLDVSVQARLLDLLRKIVRHHNLAVVIVTHDLAVARLLADQIIVMKQSKVVESGLTDQVLDDPQHPYTQLLVSSILAN